MDLRRSLFEGERLSRRGLFTGLGGLGAAAAFAGFNGAPAAAATAVRNENRTRQGDFDWNSPTENLRMLSRMWGTIEPGEEAYLYVFGPAFGILDANNFTPLFRLESLANVRTYPLENGAFRYLANQVILFTDFKTNEVLQTWENPYTGETQEVFHYRDGPLDYTLDPNAFPERYAMENQDPMERSLVLDWWFRGDTAYGDAIARTTLPNRLDPATYPRASIGPMWTTFEAYRWQALIEEMEDLSLPSVPSFRGDFQTFKPWEPWMLMGQTPGKIFSVRSTFKPNNNLDEVPDHVVRYIQDNLPEYLHAPTEFHEQYLLNDHHYKAARAPAPGPVPPIRRPGES